MYWCIKSRMVNCYHTFPNITTPPPPLDDQFPLNCLICNRHTGCKVLYPNVLCDICSFFLKKRKKSKIAKCTSLSHPAKLKAPITITSPNRQKLTIQDTRHKCAEFARQLEEMKLELAKSSIEVDDESRNDLIETYSNNPCEVIDFMNLFWQQQMELFSSNPNPTIPSNDNSILLIISC